MREKLLCGVKKGNSYFDSKYDNGNYEYPVENDSDRYHSQHRNL